MSVSENSNLNAWLALGARSRSSEDGLELNLANVDWARQSSGLPAIPVEVTSWKMQGGSDERVRELLTLLQGQKQIKAVALRGVNVNEASIGCISQIPELIEVDFSDTNFSNAHLEQICQNDRLQSINLAETSITDNGLICLKKMRQLKQLNLNKNKITEAGLHYLEGLVSLRDLSLGGTPLTGAALKWLQRLVLLEKLDLRHTHITHN
ncbi:MAG TPA: hypothetical protein DIW81_10805, partial [Planctomycetaceae bacterium]|nr:hypothetical protein [Planctomycetaceae bacterium]